jgi:RNA recognition motif-containing protein
MNKLFVSGFPLEITEIELAQLIAPHGDINTLKIVRDKKTRICKGYAFVEMNSFEAAQNTKDALNNTDLYGRVLTLNIVEEKEEPGILKPSSANPSFHSTAKWQANAERKKRPRKNHSEPGIRP